MITTYIPYTADGNLGREYNDLVTAAPTPWILFIDHDVLLLNPHWYRVCTKAIEQHPDAGMFTCYTNRIGGPHQQIESAPAGDDVMQHKAFARALFAKNQYTCSIIAGKVCSGMLLLIRKEAHAAVGGFPGKGLFGEDWGFGKRLNADGFVVYRMNGLYVYHIRDRTDGSWIAGEKTSKERWCKK